MTDNKPIEANAESRGKWTSASYAEADKLCPGAHLLRQSVPEPEADADSARGTRIHHAWAIGKDDGLSLEEKETADGFREIEAKVLSMYFGPEIANMQAAPIVEKRVWIQNAAGLRHSGQIDRMYRKGTKCLILDGKSGRIEAPLSPRNLQLRDEVVLVWKNHPLLSEVAVCIVQPLVTRTPEITVYTPEDIAVAAAELEARLIASNSPSSPRVPGETQCKFCRASSVCKEYAAWASKFVPIVLPDTGLERLRKPLAEWTGSDIALFKDIEGVLQKWIDERHEMAPLFAQNGGTVPGYKLKPGNVVDKITQPQIVFERFAGAGGTAEQFMGVVNIPKGKLKEVFAAVVALKGKALDAKMDALLDGCVESKQNAPSLVKEK